MDLICQNRHLVSYRQVPGSIPGRGSIDYFSFFLHFPLFFDSVPLLFHSNFQSWQMRSLPTLDPYVFYLPALMENAITNNKIRRSKVLMMAKLVIKHLQRLESFLSSSFSFKICFSFALRLKTASFEAILMSTGVETSLHFLISIKVHKFVNNG